MSLINEALKKAQKQREAEAAAKSGRIPAPGTGAPTPPPPPPRPPVAPPAAAPDPEPDPERSARVAYSGPAASGPKGSRGKLLIVAAAGLIVAAGGWWVLSRDEQGGAGAEPSAEVVAAAQTPDLGHRSSPPVTSEAVAPQPTEPRLDPIAGTASSAPSAKPVPASPAPIEAADPEPGLNAEPIVRFRPAANEAAVTPTGAVVTPVPAAEVPAQSQPETTEVPQQAAPIPVISPPSTERPKMSPADPSAASPRADPPVTSVAPAELVATRPVEGAPSAPTPAPTRTRQVEILPESRLAESLSSPGSSRGPNPAVLTFLENARVTGVRPSPTDPKVLMNNRVYRLNDVVDGALQLRVTVIESRQLQFTDTAGFVYTKGF